LLVFPPLVTGIADSLSDILPGGSSEQPRPEPRSVIGKFHQLLRSAVLIVLSIPLSILLAPFLLGRYTEQAKMIIRIRYSIRRTTSWRYGGWMRADPFGWLTANIIRILDRTLLLGVLFFATIPAYQKITVQMGIAGLAIMLLVFVLGGTFTYLVRDALEP